MKWYAVNVQPGSEKKAQSAIIENVDEAGISHLFGSVVIPSEKTISVKDNKKIEIDRMFMPGYIFVQCVLSEEMARIISDSAGVYRFVMVGKEILPIREREIKLITERIEQSHKTPLSNMDFSIGEVVKINDGPFATFTGIVENVDNIEQKLMISVSIFGRSTNVELHFSKVEKE